MSITTGEEQQATTLHCRSISRSMVTTQNPLEKYSIQVKRVNKVRLFSYLLDWGHNVHDNWFKITVISASNKIHCFLRPLAGFEFEYFNPVLLIIIYRLQVYLNFVLIHRCGKILSIDLAWSHVFLNYLFQFYFESLETLFIYIWITFFLAHLSWNIRLASLSTCLYIISFLSV